MKQNKFIRKCGPFEVHSISQDGYGVRLEIYPAFPRYNLHLGAKQRKGIDPSWAADPRWAIHRQKGDGGGPSIFTVIALANELEAFLNQPYTKSEVESWKDTLAEALKDVRMKAWKQMEKAFAKAAKK